MNKDNVDKQDFDEDFYLASNPDVATEVISGKLPCGKVHFEQKGKAEGRFGTRRVQPRQRLDAENFSEEYYLAQFPDIDLAVKDGRFPSGLSHYTQHGTAEGRYGRVPSGGHNNFAVVFMIYNRPEYTRLVFERIAAFKPKKLLIIADGPRNEEEVALCRDARKIAEDVDWDCEVLKNYSSKNLGCKRRVSSGLRWAFSLVEEAIIIEDDCVPDASFFYFCSAMLDFYRDDTQIMQISGSNFLSTPPTQYSYWFSRHSDIWGWATWRRAFRLYDPDMRVWPKFKKTSEVNKLGDSAFETKFWLQIFDKTHRGDIDTWDYQWHFAVYAHRGLCIVPRTNLITNIGHGPGATHTRDASAGVAGLACESVWQIYHPQKVERSIDSDSVAFFVRYYLTCQPALRYTSVEHLPDIAVANLQTELPPATRLGRKMLYTFLRKLATRKAVRFVCEPLVDYYMKRRLGADEQMPSFDVQPSTVSTVVVSHNEITARHGAGALLKRLLGNGKKDWINIYSRKHFPEEIKEGQRQILISHADRRRTSIIQRILNALCDLQPKRILCEPFNEEDCLNAIAAHDLFDVPMCLYLMDDQNVIVNEISDKIMRELLEKSRIRFAISSEMRDAYEKKYGLKFWLLPPTAPDRYSEKTPHEFSVSHKSKAALIGNIWSTEWLMRFANIVKDTNITVDWYGNAGKPFARYDSRELASKNIIVKGFLDEDDLSPTLRQYPFALAPTPSRELDIDHTWMTSLSFPSKLVTFISANLPIIVIGEQNTPAANFVQRLGVGMVSPYSLGAFQQTVNEMLQPETQLRFRDACAKAAALFSDSGLLHWIWASLEAAQPVDDRFERIFCRDNNNLTPWVDPDVPVHVLWEFRMMHKALRRIRSLGYIPDFVIDVGCSTGLVSHLLKEIFPETRRFMLVDPFLERYRNLNDYFFRVHPEFECEACAISNMTGKTTLYVRTDFYSSSTIQQTCDTKSLVVPCSTLDDLFRKHDLTGRGLLKMDVQFAEHLVIEGGINTLKHIDFVLTEVTLHDLPEGCTPYSKMIRLMDSLGYRYFDYAGEWRSQPHGTLSQQDMLFVRNELFNVALS